MTMKLFNENLLYFVLFFFFFENLNFKLRGVDEIPYDILKQGLQEEIYSSTLYDNESTKLRKFSHAWFLINLIYDAFDCVLFSSQF